jgi:hypothetical protein
MSHVLRLVAPEAAEDLQHGPCGCDASATDTADAPEEGSRTEDTCAASEDTSRSSSEAEGTRRRDGANRPGETNQENSRISHVERRERAKPCRGTETEEDPSAERRRHTGLIVRHPNL